MADPARKHLTVEDYLGWDDGTDRRHELVDGEVVAMPLPTVAHSTILGNLAREIGSRIGRPRRAMLAAGIEIPDRNDRFYQADVAVTCTPPSAGERSVPNPVLLVEVLSSSTLAHDRGVKVPDYLCIPSVQEILLVDSREPRVQVWRREGDRRKVAWTVQDVRGVPAIRLDSIDADLPLAALYENVVFD